MAKIVRGEEELREGDIACALQGAWLEKASPISSIINFNPIGGALIAVCNSERVGVGCNLI
jgi:hypothetical protein